jgi:hypothetical protein
MPHDHVIKLANAGKDPLSNQITLYEEIGSIFKDRTPGAELLCGLMDSMVRFATNQQTSIPTRARTRCTFATLLWGTGPLGRLGAREFHNAIIPADPEDPASEEEWLTLHDMSLTAKVQNLMTAYNRDLRIHGLTNLSRLHTNIVDAPFWVFGYPDAESKRKEVKARAKKENKRPYEYDSLYQLVKQNTERALKDEFENRKKDNPAALPPQIPRREDIWKNRQRFLKVLSARYFDGKPPMHKNLYYVPKYSVVSNGNAEFACQGIFGFGGIDISTYRYMQKAMNLFMDLLLAHLGHILNLESTAKGVATSVENKGFSHNLNYLVHAPDTWKADIATLNASSNLRDWIDAFYFATSDLSKQRADMRYLAARQAFIASRAWGRRLAMHIVPMSELLESVQEDASVYSTLLKVSIPTPVFVDPKNEDLFLQLPGGRAGFNAVRNILENLVRNVGKHADGPTRDRIIADTRLKLEISGQSTVELVALTFTLDGYGHSSFEQLSKAFDAGSLYLINGYLPNEVNRGTLELMLDGLTLRGLPIEWLRTKSRIEIIADPVRECIDVFVHGHTNGLREDGELLKKQVLRVERQDGTRISHTFFLGRGHPILWLTVSYARGVGTPENWTSRRLVLGRDTSSSYRSESFVVVSRADELTPAFQAFKTVSPFLRISNREEISQLPNQKEALEALWSERISIHGAFPPKKVGSSHLLVVTGLEPFVDSRIYSSQGAELVRILQVPFLRSFISDQVSADQVIRGSECAAVLSHLKEIPSWALEATKTFGSYSGPLIDGYKAGNELRAAVERLQRGQNKPSDRSFLFEYLEACFLKILIIDERFEKLHSNLKAHSRPNCNGLPDELSFADSWALQGVHLTMNLRDIEHFDSEIFQSFDFILVHDGWWRGNLGGNAAQALSQLATPQLQQRVIVHSDGDTFESAKGLLFCQRWSGLIEILELGTKAQLIQQIQRARRGKSSEKEDIWMF